MIILPPHQREREYQIQVCHWQKHHAWRTPPSRGAIHKCYTNSTLHQAENHRLNRGFLDNPRCCESAASTRSHQAVIDVRDCPPRKKDERSVNTWKWANP